MKGRSACAKQPAGIFIGIAHGPAGQFEDAGGAQHAGIQKLEQGPQLAQMVFHGRAAQRQTVASAQQAGRLGRFGVRVLDGLGFVEHNVIELDVLETHGIAAQRAVGGEHHIVSGEVVAVARQARCNRAHAAAG